MYWATMTPPAGSLWRLLDKDQFSKVVPLPNTFQDVYSVRGTQSVP
jgi:hypothetical protein